MNENKLIINIEDMGENYQAQLIALGRSKGFVNFDDILGILPMAYDDLETLEVVFDTLRNFGIQIKDDAYESANKGNGSSTKKKHQSPTEANSLENIDTNDLIGLVLKEAASYSLLTHQEEVALARRIELGRAAREALFVQGLNTEERLELFRNQVDDGWLAMEILIKANSRLVINVAKKYMGRGVPFLD